MSLPGESNGEPKGESKKDVVMKNGMIFNTVSGKISKVALGVAALGLAGLANAQVTVNKAEGWLESAYAEWQPVSGATGYNVYCDGNKIDNQLIRTYASGYVRADVLGLKAGSHTLEIAPVVNGSEGSAATRTVTVLAHDRTGFAFSNGRVPGAYNADGTLKSGATILYISENTKNTVTMDVTTNAKGGKTTCKSFQGILNCYKKGYETTPLDLRLLGNVTDSDSLVQGDMLIDLGSSESAYVTVEGVGEDAVANGWGIRIKNAQNVEVRNLGIMNVNSGEGDNVGLQQNDQYIWVHNNDFFYGDAGSDADQVKGDGALDCKKSTNITFSYNHFWDNGKSNLLGLSEGTTEDLFITYHHNWYDHSDSRHPRVRFYSAHVYNNYYDGNAKYGIGSTLGSSVFAEGNYFRNCKFPMMTSMQGSDVYAGTTTRDTKNNPTFSSENGGSIKAYDNYIEGGTFIPYGASKYTLKGVETAAGSIDTKADFDAYVVTARNQEMPASVKSFAGANTYNNFDLNSSVMYKYTADEPAQARANVTKYAGRVNGGDFKWTFDNSVDDASYAVNQPLKDALVAYRGAVKSIQGEGNLPVVAPVSSSSATSSGSAKSSSSTLPVSSSSVAGPSIPQSSSSAVNDDPVGEEAGTVVIDRDLVHNFTEEGASSDYFEFIGSLSTAKGSTSYNGEELTRCLKMESSTSIKFTLAKAATLTLVFNSDFAKNVKVDGQKVAASAGVVQVELAAGNHALAKGDVANLYMIVVNIDENAPANSSADNPSSSSAEGPSPSAGEPASSSSETPQVIATNMQSVSPMRYVTSECRLEIHAADVRRLAIFDMNGHVVKMATEAVSQSSVDLSGLKPGVYLVRLVTGSRAYQQKIAKR